MSQGKWGATAEVLAHLAADDDLMVEWAIRRHGDLRSEPARQAGANLVRNELVHGLLAAVRDRARREG